MYKFFLVIGVIFWSAASVASTGQLFEDNWSCYELSQSGVGSTGAALPAKDQKKALEGDAEIAYRLSQATRNIDHRMSGCWMVVAAENGSPVAQYHLWIILKNSRDDRDKIRGLFWLNKAYAQSYGDAVTSMKDERVLIESIKSTVGSRPVQKKGSR